MMNRRRTALHFLTWLIFCLLVVILAKPFESSEAAENDKRDQKRPGGAAMSKPANFDALADAVPTTRGLSQANESSRTQTEPRFNVPTFLWASESGEGHGAKMRSDLAGKRDDQASTARSHLSRYADRYRLSKTDLLSARVSSVHDTGSGAIIVKFRQELGGVEVFRDEVNVIMDRDHGLIAISGYLTGDHTADTSPAGRFTLRSEDALGKALSDLSGRSIDPARFTRDIDGVSGITSGDTGPYTRFTAEKGSIPGVELSDEPSRTKSVMFHLPSGYVPAYYVETAIMVVPSPRTGIIDNSGAVPMEEWGYAYVVSAVDGTILFRMNQVAEQAYSYRVWADPATQIPYDTPAGNSVHPKINPVPDGVQYPFAAQQDVSIQNYPFSQNDPWLPAGATETVGNNADAFLNIFSPDGYGPATTIPTDIPTGDYRAQLTGPNAFLHSNTPGTLTSTAVARQGAIQQLFYNVNFLHDWYYDAGFDEASGNAQTDNFGRGGLGNDNIRAQAQDFSGFSNANMLTPSDGGRPRMRMYIFPSLSNHADVLTSAAAGKRSMGVSMSGPQAFDVTADIVIPTFTAAGPGNPQTGCDVTNVAALDGKIAMFDFGPAAGTGTDGTGCNFSTRIARITTTTNAVATYMVWQSAAASANAVVNVTGFVAANTKPFGSISWNSAAAIKTALASGTVNVRLFRDGDRDGTLDNQIVAHEWGHYLSNRLIGNGAGLNTNMSAGMGEGWSDFTAMLLTVRPEDTSTPSNATWNGVYPMGTFATSGVNPLGVGNNGYYFAIRRIPYSTDMNINPLTYGHTVNGVPLPVGPPIAFGQSGVSNSQVHNSGEIWANMLWECYASLLRDTQGASPRLTFAQAQTRMKNYLVAAFKMTPNSPTMLETRDAVLAAAFANDPVDGALFGQAFAKRGAGTRAVSADRFSTTNVGSTENFYAGGDITYQGSILDDTIVSTDDDGYLDSNETGQLNITIRNSGFAALTAATAQVTTTNPSITFPNGNTVNFPNVPAFTSATVPINVQAGALSGGQVAEFNLTLNQPGMPGPVAGSYRDYANVSEISTSSRTDSVESRFTPLAIAGNAALSNPESARFRRQAQNPFSFKWFVPDSAFGTDQYLTTPPLTVNKTGTVTLAFDHSWGFEFDGGGNYDGGVVEMSVNGGAWTDIGTTAYNGVLVTYAGNVNPLAGRPAFVNNSAGTIHSVLTQSVAPGASVQFRFRSASDASVGAAGWLIDEIELGGILEAPFSTLVEDLAPTAPATVSGKVTDSTGRGIARALVSMRNSEGEVRYVTTNTFGNFRFHNVDAARSYVFHAAAKGQSFAPEVVAVTGNLSSVTLIGD